MSGSHSSDAASPSLTSLHRRNCKTLLAVTPARLRPSMATFTGAPLPPAGPEKEKPLARSAPVTAPLELANPGKKTRRRVPMTDEERARIDRLKELHASGMEELHELMEIHKELRDYHDELLFRRRCLAARLVSRIVFQRRDAAYVRHQLGLGLKVGDKLPEELKQARPPISMALFLWHEMGRALHIGMDNFLDEYSNTEEYRRGMLALVPGAVPDENGAPPDCVASQE